MKNRTITNNNFITNDELLKLNKMFNLIFNKKKIKHFYLAEELIENYYAILTCLGKGLINYDGEVAYCMTSNYKEIIIIRINKNNFYLQILSGSHIYFKGYLNLLNLNSLKTLLK